MSFIGRMIDRLKGDEQLMREETRLFSQILAHYREGTPVPSQLQLRQDEKLQECVKRGHVGNRLGGWDH